MEGFHPRQLLFDQVDGRYKRTRDQILIFGYVLILPAKFRQEDFFAVVAVSFGHSINVFVRLHPGVIGHAPTAYVRVPVENLEIVVRIDVRIFFARREVAGIDLVIDILQEQSRGVCPLTVGVEDHTGKHGAGIGIGCLDPRVRIPAHIRRDIREIVFGEKILRVIGIFRFAESVHCDKTSVRPVRFVARFPIGHVGKRFREQTITFPEHLHKADVLLKFEVRIGHDAPCRRRIPNGIEIVVIHRRNVRDAVFLQKVDKLLIFFHRIRF